jgi:hypothetical protein
MSAAQVFADVESPISLAFLTRYPTPAHAAALGEKRMAAFLIKHGYSGRRPAAQLLARLRTAPTGTTSPVVTEALRDAVLALVAQLTALNTAIRDLDRSVTAHLHEHPDGEIFTSFPRSGQVNAAQIRAELAEPGAYTGPEAISALAGLVPVTRASGKHRAVSFRWACNKRLRVALTTFADNSRHASPPASRPASAHPAARRAGWSPLPGPRRARCECARRHAARWCARSTGSPRAGGGRASRAYSAIACASPGSDFAPEITSPWRQVLIAFGLTGTTGCPAASSASTSRPSGRSIATGA